MQKGQEFHYLKHPTSFFGAVFPHYTQGGGGWISQTIFFSLSMLYVKQYPWSEEFPKYAPLRTFCSWALIFGTPHSSSSTLHFMVGNYSLGQEHYQKQFPAQLWLHGGCPYSGNALDVGITVHIMPWTSGPTSIQKIIQSYFKKFRSRLYF